MIFYNKKLLVIVILCTLILVYFLKLTTIAMIFICAKIAEEYIKVIGSKF